MRLFVTLLMITALSAPAVLWATPPCKSSFEVPQFAPYTHLRVRAGTERLCGVGAAQKLLKVEYGPVFWVSFGPDGVRVEREAESSGGAPFDAASPVVVGGEDPLAELRGHTYLAWIDAQTRGLPAMMVDIGPQFSFAQTFEHARTVMLQQVEVVETSAVEPLGNVAQSGVWCLALAQPLETGGAYLLVDQTENAPLPDIIARVEVALDPPLYSRFAPRFEQVRKELDTCSAYGFVVLEPADTDANTDTQRLYEWTIRAPNGDLMLRDFGAEPYLFGTTHAAPGRPLFKPGVIYDIEIRALNPDGTTSEASYQTVEFRLSPGSPLMLGIFLGAIGETLIPDLRLGLDGSLTVSFPVGVTLWRSARQNGCAVCGRLLGYVEPQIATRDGTARLFGYLRGQLGFDTAEVYDILVPLEAGYLYGGDGHGPGVGLGVGSGIFGRWSIEVVGRRYFLRDRPARHDLTLDVSFYPLDGLW